MLFLNRNSVVYVLCPNNTKTGGTELAHQLVYQINKNGGKSKIAYFSLHGEPLRIIDAFKCYVTDFVDLKKIEDSPDNIVVFPEANLFFLNQFHKVQKCIWWMSVDNYLKYRSFSFLLKMNVHFVLNGLLKLAYNNFFKVDIRDKQITHFYQSEYARNFLENAGITKVHRLSDYLNEEYLHINIYTDRKDIVLYNPRKGLAFTQMLMKFAPNITWVPLQNMTTEQVKETLHHSKVYIDFGNHPGKDRFPREAAMCGCCVITGKRGSAKFFEDVPIADEFKFDESCKTIPLIISKIRECLDNYETESTKFNSYRDFIKSEYQTFQDDVKKIFITDK